MSIVPYEKVKETVEKALLQAGLSKEKAEICAQIHAQSSADGVGKPRFKPCSPFCGVCIRRPGRSGR